MSKAAARWWKRQREMFSVSAQSVQEEAMAEGNGKPPVEDEAQSAIQDQQRAALGPMTALVPIEERLAALERHYGDLNTAFGQLRAYALSLGKQEDYQKTVMERNIRAAAADLAIKSATDETKADAGALTTMAGAWLVWLKGGDQPG